MNDWRRGLLAVYSALFVGLAALLIVLAWNDQQQLDLDLSGFRLVSFIETSGAERLLFTGLMFFVAWFALITLAIALVPDRQRYRETLTVQTPGGSLTLTPEMVATVLRDELERLPSVLQAHPSVRVTKDAVEPDLTIVLADGTNVPNAVNAVQVTAGETLRERFGVRMLQAGVSIAPPPGGGGASRFAPPPPPIAVRRIVRPNDGNLEFPADDSV